MVRLQNKFKLNLKFKFRFNFNLEKFIQGFFQKIADKIEEYKIIKEEEKRREQLEETKQMQKEKSCN